MDKTKMWELNDNGTLVNSYSGLCATVKSVKVDVISGGISSWIATGRKGELYVAFFNLNASIHARARKCGVERT
ncbi:hypothetical protein RIF29_29903 [Crotalaria pallida]|uniref:Uncharacterized protein n=1 Tax=Crotalaria pallida TaxID=3830 RepID=A0AAN9EFV5_CROPI